MSTMQMLTLLISTLIIQQNLARIPPTSSTTTSEQYTFTVNSTTFQNGNITCHKSLCNIICDKPSGCAALTINANQSDMLTLSCSQTESCRNLIISAGAQVSTNIQCAAASACSAAVFDINSRFVDISCSHPSATSSSAAACGYTSINAAKSSNVSVSCASDWSCYQMDLHCPLNNGKCNVECDAYVTYSCGYIAIFTPNEKTIDIRCGTGSNTCLGTDVYCGNTVLSPKSDVMYDTTGAQWECASDDCCPFYAGKISCPGIVAICDIDCTSRNCRNYLIDGSNVQQQFTVACSAQNGGCEGAVIQCPDQAFASCAVNCQDSYSCDQITIQGANVNALTINCTGVESCAAAQLYCPSHAINACNIKCNADDYQVCYNMDIYANNSFVQHYLNLDCGNNSDQYGCTYTTLNCELSSVQSTLKTAVDLYFDATESEWECEHKLDTYCCPWLNTEPVECGVGSSCYVDCSSSDCAGVIVNASMAQSLSISCGINQCYSSTVYCPHNGDCSIRCYGQNSCKYMTVYGNNSRMVQVDCSVSDSGCSEMNIFVINVMEFMFNAQGGQSNNVNVYADNASSVVLQCRGEYACYFMNVYADNVDSISIDAGYNYGFAQGLFRAQYADSVSISCASQNYEYGCSSNDWYLPDFGSNTEINCYGYGCNDFGNIYIVYSMRYLTVNVVGCSECSSGSICIGDWTIYCKTTSLPTDPYGYSATFYGSSCSGDCDCDAFVDNVFFTDDDTDSQCIMTVVNDNDSPISSSVAVIVVAVFGALFCVCFIMVCICVLSQRRYGAWGRTNYIAPVPGIQPAVSQPSKVIQPQQRQPMPVIMMAPQQQQQAMPVVMMAPQQQQIRYVPVQQVQVPAQQNNVQYVPAQQRNVQYAAAQPYNPNVNVVHAAPYNPSAPAQPGYDEMEQASAPPAYNQVGNANDGEMDGAETNY